MLVNIPQDTLNRLLKTLNAISIDIAVSPCPHEVILSGGLIWIDRQLRRRIVELDDINRTLAWILL
jgi:hypothetical protein